MTDTIITFRLCFRSFPPPQVLMLIFNRIDRFQMKIVAMKEKSEKNENVSNILYKLRNALLGSKACVET